MIQYGVAILDKGTTILCGQRLVLNHLANSESINTTLKEYKPDISLPTLRGPVWFGILAVTLIGIASG